MLPRFIQEDLLCKPHGIKTVIPFSAFYQLSVGGPKRCIGRVLAVLLEGESYSNDEDVKNRQAMAIDISHLANIGPITPPILTTLGTAPIGHSGEVYQRVATRIRRNITMMETLGKVVGGHLELIHDGNESAFDFTTFPVYEVNYDLDVLQKASILVPEEEIDRTAHLLMRSYKLCSIMKDLPVIDTRLLPDLDIKPAANIKVGRIPGCDKKIEYKLVLYKSSLVFPLFTADINGVVVRLCANGITVASWLLSDNPPELSFEDIEIGVSRPHSTNTLLDEINARKKIIASEVERANNMDMEKGKYGQRVHKPKLKAYYAHIKENIDAAEPTVTITTDNTTTNILFTPTFFTPTTYTYNNNG